MSESKLKFEHLEVTPQENGQINSILDETDHQNSFYSAEETEAEIYEEETEYIELQPNMPSFVITEENEDLGTKVHKWSDDETHTLLDLYSEYQNKDGSLKNFRSKKELWIFIAHQMKNIHDICVTFEQVEGRFKTVVKKTRSIIKHNKTSGGARKRIPYEKSMDKIFVDDVLPVPDISVGPNHLQRNDNILLEEKPSSPASTHHLRCSSQSLSFSNDPKLEAPTNNDDGLAPARKKPKLSPKAIEKTEELATEVHKWSDDETQTLLSLYNEHQSQVGLMKRFRSKKEMWFYIAKEIGKTHNIYVTFEQVEGRFKTIVKKTREVIKHNATSRVVKKSIPFETLMDKILVNDDSLVPETVLVETLPAIPANAYRSCDDFQSPSFSNERAQQPELQTLTDTDEPPARKKQKCFVEKMIDRLIESRDIRSKLSEESKERRHRERMEQNTKIINLIESVLEKLNTKSS